MTRNTTRQSGSSNDFWPQHVKYPAFLQLAAAPEFRSCLCYVVTHYGCDGISALIERSKSGSDVNVRATFADWAGATVDPINDETARSFVTSHLRDFTATMKLAGVAAAQFYMTRDLTLVDIRVGVDRLVGPGMVRDLFGKMIKTQTVVRIVTVDEAALKAILAGTGSYAGNLVVKPSAFKTVERDDNRVPLYAAVVRE